VPVSYRKLGQAVLMMEATAGKLMRWALGFTKPAIGRKNLNQRFNLIE
jgi:hypothetical protein